MLWQQQHIKSGGVGRRICQRNVPGTQFSQRPEEVIVGSLVDLYNGDLQISNEAQEAQKLAIADATWKKVSIMCRDSLE